MFYCEPCRVKNNWPHAIGFGSAGHCEVCNTVAVCHDVPSSRLPIARVTETVRSYNGLEIKAEAPPGGFLEQLLGRVAVDGKITGAAAIGLVDSALVLEGSYEDGSDDVDALDDPAFLRLVAEQIRTTCNPAANGLDGYHVDRLRDLAQKLEDADNDARGDALDRDG